MTHASRWVMTLEPRIMFDGAALAAAFDANANADTAVNHSAPETAAPEQSAPTDASSAGAPATSHGRKEVAFVDASVSDYRNLVEAVRPGIDVVVIGDGQSGLAQMVQWANTHSGYDAIHVLSHGADATLALGRDTITAANLSDAGIQADLAALGKALTTDGDLLLYGCSVASDTAGQTFVAALAAATGADVAASDDPTGAAPLGGDWSLEAKSGTVETTAIAAPSYDGILNLAGTSVTMVAKINDAGQTPFSQGPVATGSGVEIDISGSGHTIDIDTTANTITITMAFADGWGFLNDRFQLVFTGGGTSADNITSITRTGGTATDAADYGGSVSATPDKTVTIIVPAHNVVAGTIVFTYTTGPALSSTSPADNATGVSPTADIVLNFNEAPVKGSGNIVVKRTSDNATIETIAVTSSQVTISGNQVTVNPSVTLADTTEYYVLMDTTAFHDNVNNDCVGISSTTALSFTTADTTPPASPTLGISADTAGTSTSDGITKTAAQTVTVTGEANATVDVNYGDGSAHGSGTVGGGGSVGIGPHTYAADGTYTISASLTDASGNTSTAGTKTITIDRTPPTVTTGTSQTMNPAQATNGAADGATVCVLTATDATNIPGFTDGLTWSISGGADAGKFQLSGSNLVINNAGGLAAGSYTVQVQAMDKAGNTGTGTITLTVLPNSLPAITGNGSTAYTEQQGPLGVATGLTIADPDGAGEWSDGAGANGTLAAKINTGYASGDTLTLNLPASDPGSGGLWVSGTDLKLGATTIGTVSATSVTTGTITVTFASAGVTDAQVTAIAQAFTYTSTSDAPGASRTIRFTASDYHGGAGTADQTINITQVNDLPTNAAVSASLVEDGTYTFTSANFTTGFGDVDGDSFAGMKLTSAGATAGTLWLDANGNGANDDAALTTNSSVSAAQIAAGKLKFTPAAHAGGAGYATFTFQSSDGTAYSGSDATVTIDVTAVNDAPVRSAGTVSAISVNEDSARVTAVALGLSGLTYGPGGGVDENGQALTYTITAIPSFVTLWKSDGTTQVSANDVVTLPELRGLKYKTIADANGTGTITWTVMDDGGTANGGANTLTESLSITVAAVNDAPVSTGSTPTPINVVQDSSNTLAVTLGLAGVTYGKGGGADESGQALTYAITGIPSFITLWKGDGITRVNSGDALTLADLQGLKYKTVANGNGTANLTWRVTDDGGTANGGSNSLDQTLAITVTAINNAPTLATNLGKTVNEGATATVAAAQLAVSDADNPAASTLTYTLTTAPAKGTLWVDANGNGVLDAGEALTTNGTFTQADIAANKLKYTHDGSETTSDSFGFSYSDGVIATPVAGNTFAFTVTPVNDSPTVTPSSGQAEFSGGAVAVAPGLTLADVDSGNLTEAVVGIFNPQDGTSETLSSTYGTGMQTVNGETLTFTLSNGNQTLAITGTASKETYQLALRSVRFNDTAASVNSTARVIRFQVRDDSGSGTQYSGTADRMVTISNAPAAPTSTGTSSTPPTIGSGQDGVGTAYRTGTGGDSNSPLATIVRTATTADNGGSANFGLPAISLTTDDRAAGGFRVAVAAKPAGGGDTLLVNLPLPDAVVAEGGRMAVKIPAEAFAATRADAVVTLTATRADGAALPGWMNFDPRTGTFEGTPPPGFKGVVAIKVVARDDQGHEAVQTLKIVVGQSDQGRQGVLKPVGRPALAAQLRDLSLQGRMAKQAALFNALPRSGTVT